MAALPCGFTFFSLAGLVYIRKAKRGVSSSRLFDDDNNENESKAVAHCVHCYLLEDADDGVIIVL